MTSKERVKKALQHEKTDRVPVFMWFHPATARRLAKVLDIPVSRVGEAMGDDIRQTWVNNNYAMEGISHERDGESHTDFWGLRWVKQGDFNQMDLYPLAGCEQEAVLSYAFPEEHIADLVSNMAPVAANAKDCFVGADVSPCAFEMYNRLRGMEDAALDLVMQPDMAGEMIGRCAGFAAALAQAVCNHYAIDWLWTGDDAGSQQSMLMSPELWRELVKPALKRVMDIGKANGLPVAFHSCGAIRAIIPDLIEIGVDVLNPIQCNCPGMDPLELKKEFGDRLSFMGGVDTQGVLPNGTPDDVRRATARLIEGMASDGGYILAASHTVPPETPDENIFAMYHEAGITKEEIFDRAAGIRSEK